MEILHGMNLIQIIVFTPQKFNFIAIKTFVDVLYNTEDTYWYLRSSIFINRYLYECGACTSLRLIYIAYIY